MKAGALLSFNPEIGLGKKIGFWSLLLAGVLLITILQDLLHAYFKQYPFYLSESLLFKSFWVLFLPLIGMQWALIKKYRLVMMGNYPAVSWLLATVLPVAGHLLLFPVVLEVTSTVFLDHTYWFAGALAYTLREELYKCLLVYGLVAYFGFTKKASAAITQTEVTPQVPAAKVTSTTITIREGRENIPVPVADIVYISSANPYVAIRTLTGRHLHLTSLKTIAETLDPSQFVRVHKSSLVNIRQVASFHSRLNGDYDLCLLNGETIRMSRNYSQEFKKLFG